MRPIRQKPHRLPDVAYHGKKFVDFTACEMNRKPGLTCETVHGMVRETLTEAAERFQCRVPIYCLMPDHLHVLLQGMEDTSRAKHAMNRFKQKSGEWLAAHRPDLEWQKDFYDHVLRAREGYGPHINYIALNPFRAGLVQEDESYPFMGAIGYDLRQVLDDPW